MNILINQALQIQQIPQIVVMLMRTGCQKATRPTLMARLILMMTIALLQRISHHQKMKEGPTIFLIMDGDMIECAVVVKRIPMTLKQNSAILVGFQAYQHFYKPFN